MLYDLKVADLMELDRMGEKSAANVVQAIQGSKDRPLERVLYALGIRHIGLSTSRILVHHFVSMDALAQASKEDLVAVHEIGPRMAESIRAFFQEPQNRDLLKRLQEKGLTMEGKQEGRGEPLTGKRFVFTGAMDAISRSKAQEMVLEQGGEVSGSVSNKTDYLVVGERPGSKRKKAEELGIIIINQEDFLKMMEELK